jgi:hypothetical protein
LDVGSRVGAFVGLDVGSRVGAFVGLAVSFDVGSPVGAYVDEVKLEVGLMVVELAVGLLVV